MEAGFSFTNLFRDSAAVISPFQIPLQAAGDYLARSGMKIGRKKIQIHSVFHNRSGNPSHIFALEGRLNRCFHFQAHANTYLNRNSVE